MNKVPEKVLRGLWFLTIIFFGLMIIALCIAKTWFPPLLGISAILALVFFLLLGYDEDWKCSR